MFGIPVAKRPAPGLDNAPILSDTQLIDGQHRNQARRIALGILA